MLKNLSQSFRKLSKNKGLLWMVLFAVAAAVAIRLFLPAPKPVPPPKTVKRAVVIPAPKPPVRIPAEKPAVPVKKTALHPKIAFIIDDIGYSQDYKKNLITLGNKVTYAILPQLKYSGTYAKLSEKTGAKVILHLPMEAINGMSPGPGLIKRSMSTEEILEVLRRDIDAVPHLIGVNNHMGSLGTSDRHVMETVLKELKRRNLLFVDSRTSKQSIAPEVAGQLRIPFLKRDVFIDNLETESHVREKIRETARVASEQGYAVAIGHYKEITLKVLAEEIPLLEQQGYEITSLPVVLENKKTPN
jgi:polysaccharide deacetylase 2 family uncharacterized protein YibQ